MKPGLKSGDRARFSMKVQPGDTVPALFSDRNAFRKCQVVLPPDRADGMGLRRAVAPLLRRGRGLTGHSCIDVDHTSATLPGQVVTVETEVEEVDGRFIWFRVTAHDGIDQIGTGRHRRAVIRNEKFNDRLDAKRAQFRAGGMTMDGDIRKNSYDDSSVDALTGEQISATSTSSSQHPAYAWRVAHGAGA